MTNETANLLKLIKQNKSLNEISSILGLSNKQLFIKFSMLENAGYLVDRKYSYNGDINYSFSNPFVTHDNEVKIEVPENLKKYRVLLISDTHLDNVRDNLKYLDGMMEHCVKENISIVLHCGDFYEGIYYGPYNRCKDDSAIEQIAYGLKNYPYDKNVLHITVLGNHDATFWFEKGIDIKKIISDRRHDIIPVGYGYGVVNIGDFKFRLQHKIDSVVKVSAPESSAGMIIAKGHSHDFKVAPGAANLTINVPAISDVGVRTKVNPAPGMIDMQLSLDEEGNNICSEYLQQFIFINGKPVRVSEIKYQIPIPKQEKAKVLTKNDLVIPRLSNLKKEIK